MSNHTVDFVKNNWKNAVILQKKYGIHPVISLSQSAKETGWGQSFLAQTQNNYFGMMAAGDKNEYWSGKIYQKTGSQYKWKVYDTPLQSFLDYGRLLSTGSNYKNVIVHADNPAEFAKAIANSKYITNADGREKYYTDLISINKTVVGVIEKENLQNTAVGIGLLLALITVGLLIS